jgi:small-conductance mechanosensitive channel
VLDIDFVQEGIIEDITAFCIRLRLDDGRQLTYPNNIVLQKGVEKIPLRGSITPGSAPPVS